MALLPLGTGMIDDILVGAIAIASIAAIIGKNRGRRPAALAQSQPL